MKKSNFLKWLGVVTVFASTGINAATFELGTLTPTASVAIINPSLAAGAYSDDWNFQVSAEASGLGINVSSLTELPFNLGGVGATIASYELWNNTTNTLMASATPTVSPGAGSTTGYQASFSVPTLSVGNSYAVKIGGTAGNLGGFYAGSLAVVAVPELEEWAMMILGIGLIAMRLKGSRSDSHSVGMPIFA